MPAVIFNGAKTKNLKDEMQLLTGSSIISRAVDPTSVATSAEPGSLLMNPSTNVLYKKLDSGSSTNWEIIQSSSASIDQSYELSNLGLAASVAANALTIALKDKSGANPSGGSPVYVGFRNATLATGQYSRVTISSSLSMVVSSGSTLGTSDGDDYYLYVYLLNNAGTAELAVSLSYFEDGIHSTTAEGGAGTADSNAVMYSTTARSNVATRLIGRLLVNEATAGTWASAPSEISLMPFDVQIPMAKYTESSTGIPNGGTLVCNTRVFDTRNAYDGVTNGTFTVPEAGKYTARACFISNAAISGATTQYVQLVLDKNTAAEQFVMNTQMWQTSTNLSVYLTGAATCDCAVGDVLTVIITNQVAATLNGTNTAKETWVEFFKVG